MEVLERTNYLPGPFPSIGPSTKPKNKGGTKMRKPFIVFWWPNDSMLYRGTGDLEDLQRLIEQLGNEYSTEVVWLKIPSNNLDSEVVGKRPAIRFSWGGDADWAIYEHSGDLAWVLDRLDDNGPYYSTSVVWI
jgi:hypothetical protein